MLSFALAVDIADVDADGRAGLRKPASCSAPTDESLVFGCLCEGRADARKALLDRLTAGSGRGGAGAGKTSGERAGKASSPARRATGRRAPRGSVRRFVVRALKEHPGATASEIAGHATTDIERSVKPALIRNELYNGGKQGRDVSDILTASRRSTATPGIAGDTGFRAGQPFVQIRPALASRGVAHRNGDPRLCPVGRAAIRRNERRNRAATVGILRHRPGSTSGTPGPDRTVPGTRRKSRPPASCRPLRRPRPRPSPP